MLPGDQGRGMAVLGTGSLGPGGILSWLWVPEIPGDIPLALLADEVQTGPKERGRRTPTGIKSFCIGSDGLHRSQAAAVVR